MSGRIRTIKPELIEDAVTAGLTHEAFRLFVGMLLLADDHGNLRASPRWLEGQVFHARPLADGVTMASLLEELRAKLVRLYEVDGQAYAHITGWRKHQKVEHPGAPRVPLPPGWKLRQVELRNPKTGRRVRVDYFSEPPLEPSEQRRDAVATASEHHPDAVALDHDLDHDLDLDPEGEHAPAAPPSPARLAAPPVETEPAAPTPSPAPLALVAALREELLRATDLLDGVELAPAADRAAHALDAFGIADGAAARRIAIEAIAYGRTSARADRDLDAAALLARIEQKIVWIAQKQGDAPPPGGGDRRPDRDRPARDRGAPCADRGTDEAAIAADAEASARKLDAELARADRAAAQQRAIDQAQRARLRRGTEVAPAPAGAVFTAGSLEAFGLKRPSFDRRSA